MKTQIARTLAVLGLSALFVFGFVDNAQANAAEFKAFTESKAVKFERFDFTSKAFDKTFNEARFEFANFDAFDAKAVASKSTALEGFDFTASNFKNFSVQDSDFQAANFRSFDFKPEMFEGNDFTA